MHEQYVVDSNEDDDGDYDHDDDDDDDDDDDEAVEGFVNMLPFLYQ